MARGRRRLPASKQASARPRKRSPPQVETPTEVPQAPGDFGEGGLGKRARELWDRVAPELWGLGLLTDLDVDILEDWCYTRALLEQVRAVVAEEGVAVETEAGSTKRSAEAQMVTQLSQRLQQLSTDLGLSPRARGSLDVKPPQPKGDGDSEFEKHAARRRKAIAR